MPKKKTDRKSVLEKIVLKHAIVNAFHHNSRASAKAVLGKVIAEKPAVKKDVKKVMKIIIASVDSVNSWSTAKLKKEFGKLKIRPKKRVSEKGKLSPLAKAVKGKVVMRLAPYPSGPLHIGNARMVVLNDEYVKRYGGKLLLVYDDTIGSEAKRLSPDGYALIKDGVDWLGVKIHKELYKSDRMLIFYKHAETMLRKNFAYVCFCPADELRANRKAGKACIHRKHTPKDNLKMWKAMLDGKYKEGEAIVRLKTDIQHPNPAFRDRVLLRISNRKHPRVGNKYHVWPMLEYSWAIDDHELGMTHILRGKDLMMEDVMEIFIWGKLGWGAPEFLHYGMLKLKEAKLSKSKARAAIEAGVMSGWDDPRTWSLQSLRRRGICPEAVRSFIIGMGMSLADVTIPAEILYAENRKMIDKKANRYFAVFDPFKISVNLEKSKKRHTRAPLHPELPKRGKRKIPVLTDEIYIEREDYEKYKGKEVGLINLFSVMLGKNSKFVSDNIKIDSPKVHWVSKPHVKIKIIMPDGEVKNAIAEPDIRKSKVDDLIQLVRVGFCRVDKGEKDIVLYFAHK